MNRPDRSAMEAYVQALLPERERYLHQHALNKARVITRSMRPAEKEAYLQSEAFQTMLRQLQRRDKIWQGLLRGELVLSGDRTEFERLSKLIAKEMSALRPQVDVLIVMMHWGTEFTFEPNSEQKEMARFLNENGADIVYGSHSHSVQPVEFIGYEHKTLVYYSLGNFASQDDDIARTPKGQETFDNAYQVGLLSQFTVRLNNGKVEISDLSNHLIVNHLNYDMKKFALVPLEQYDEFYEKTHFRYSLGFNRDFINGLYDVVNKEIK